MSQSALPATPHCTCTDAALASPSAEAANRECHCLTADKAELGRRLELAGLEGGLESPLLREHAHLFAAVPLFVSQADVDAMASIIRAVEEVIATPRYVERALEHAPPIARLPAGARGVFFGYDFHLGEGGPRVIEINTNAGGALLCLHLASAQRACCAQMKAAVPPALPLHALEPALVEMFRREWRLMRGEAPLGTVAIVDDEPSAQHLYPEFVLFRELLRRHGVEALIADGRELTYRDGAVWAGEARVDLVYNRLTDFYLEGDEHAALREAYLAGDVVLTPHPRAHALYANKQNLVLLSDEDFLRGTGVPEATWRVVLAGVPETVMVTPENADALWGARKQYFFKPTRGYGSKAAYRGDKLTKGTWAELRTREYIAQRFVPPSERVIAREGQLVPLKVDVRNYVYDGAVQLLAARLYQGQTTNFRTAGGGFAPVCAMLHSKSGIGGG